MDTTGGKAWAGEYEGPEGYVALVEKKCAAGEASLSARASAYYSYARALGAKGDENGFNEYLTKAIADTDVATSTGALSADDFDIRQSILRAAGRMDEALAAIESGLAKGGSAVTQVLLLAGKVDILASRDDHEAHAVMGEIERRIPEVERENPEQAIRLYRAAARFAKGEGDAAKLAWARAAAERLIDQTGAEDQRAKLIKDLS